MGIISKLGQVHIGKNTRIHPSVEIRCIGDIIIGDFTVIGEGCNIQCRTFKCGSWLYMPKNVEIGRGGCFNPDSHVTIGDHVGIFEGTIINPNSPVTIGNDVGIGAEVMIWTHGAWLDILLGFPSDFGGVTIGNDVWLPARSVVLPNVTIGNDVVIGIGSIVNRDIPDGAFAAGSPCKVIKENAYPKELSEEQVINLLNPMLRTWEKLIATKGFDEPQVYYSGYKELHLMYMDTDRQDLTPRSVTFNLDKKTISGATDHPIVEDLRDYLRRNGIKIYTDKHFKSI